MTSIDSVFRRTALCAALAIASLTLVAPPALAAQNTEAAAARPKEDRAYALVQLAGEPLASYAKTKPARGKKIDFNSTRPSPTGPSSPRCATTSRRGCKANAPQGADRHGLVDIALNAVAVKLNGTSLAHDPAATPWSARPSTRASTGPTARRPRPRR